MKLKDLLMIDTRENGAIDKLHDALYRLPFFKDLSGITTEDIESAIKKMQRKYPVRMAHITTAPGATEEEPLLYYSFMVKRTDTHEHIKTVWAMTIHEGLAKVALLIFGYIKNTLRKEGGE